MDKIEKIRTEIERRIRELDEQIVDIYDSKAVLRKNELQRLLSFLDTLSEKEPEADLEKEIEWEWVHREKQEVDLIECAEMDREEFARFARHFAEWGAEHTPLPEDTVIFQKGIEEGKRLMLEEAVECSVYAGKEGDKWIVSYIGNYESMLKTCKSGDKVRIIIVNEEKNG